ncbi:hypothetical protein ABB37_07585 [Leptomonas pyrrhocoris]|uniref:Uncharacterized protein n=1 Tax=Leptomonas pyrrhocoris TaxID=157538 RepID=A0A0M9FV74_LEPPY|nr:hypothetical protein ABB37_07585 [Leptomonas pyrrhocoris]KPA76760.1 hypothetical protein ABB37_07585 [Leptomonas pyrrhocoris]|eukprot:XP_015655199.1 hypothetical protein ABB37_07585 [Leptomonas pyrrhocoris]
MRKTVVLAERESSFVATVREDMPYRWSALDFSVHLIGSLRLNQITYLPPTSLEELRNYDASAGASPALVHSVRAIVRTVTANNKVEDFVLACFPLEVSRLTKAELFTVPPTAKSAEAAAADDLPHTGSVTAAVHPASSNAESGPSPRLPSISSLLPRRRDAFEHLTNTFVLPCATDVASGLDVHVGLDGFTELRVEGPGTVVFSGEEKLGVLNPSRGEYSFQ